MGFHPYEDWESKIVKTVIEFSTTIRLTDNDANSSYNALVTRIEISQGFSFLLSYTYAKSLDCGSLIDDQPRDIYNLSRDKGRSDFDIRQNAILSGNWTLPFGPGAIVDTRLPWRRCGLIGN
jgi:hypothetical protein